MNKLEAVLLSMEDPPVVRDLRSLLVRYAVLADDGKTFEEEDVTRGLLDAYTAMAIAVAEHNEDPEIAIVTENAAEKVYVDAYAEAYRAEHPKASNEAIEYWPDHLPLDGRWPVKVLKQIASARGHIHAGRHTAMAKMFAEEGRS